MIDDLWSIQAANGLMLLGYGLLWTGARVFEGRRPVPLSIVAGTLIWIAACQFDAFRQSVPARVVLASTLIGIYSLAFVYELWRGRHDGLVSRWPVMAIALIHMFMFPVRAPYVLSLPFPLEQGAWMGHGYRLRFRGTALRRTQAQQFREWLLAEAADASLRLRQRLAG